MSFLTTLKYKNYADKIINTGEDYQNASRKFKENIEKTIPKNFNGRTAQKANDIAWEIASELHTAGVNVESIGRSVKRIVENNDID